MNKQWNKALMVSLIMIISSMAGCLDAEEDTPLPADNDIEDNTDTGNNTTTDDQILPFGNVMVSTYHVGELVSAVAGDHVTIEYMSQNNIPVHDYEPSVADIVRLQNSDIFFYHGLNLEPWVDSTLSSLDNAPPSYMTHAMPSGQTTLDYESMLVSNLCELLNDGPFESTTLAMMSEDGHDVHDDHDDHNETEDHDDHNETEDHDDHNETDDHDDHDGHEHSKAEMTFENPAACPDDTTIQVFHMEEGEYILEFESEHDEDFNMAVLKMLGGHAHHDHSDHGDEHGDDHDDHDEHGDEMCHNAETHENYESTEEECEAAGHIWGGDDEHDDHHGEEMCHNTETHENYESTEEDCDSAGHVWMSHDEHVLPEIHAELIAHTLSFFEAISIEGEWIDEWNSSQVIDSDSWNGNTITHYDNDEMWAVAENGADSWNPGLWSKYDWTWSSGELYYCQSTYAAETEADALSADSAISTDLDTGCGGFPWSQMDHAHFEAISIEGEWIDEWNSSQVIDSDSWNGNTITHYDNDEMWAVAENGADSWNPGLWSKYDWTWSSGELYYCQSTYAAETEADALSADSAISTDLDTGCGGFPWSQMDHAHDDHDDHDEMVCYDMNTHNVNMSLTTESDCQAAGLMWIAANSGPSGDDHSDEEQHHEVGAVVIHIEAEGDYGFALPKDVEIFVMMEEGGHEDHDDHGHGAGPFEWAGMFEMNDTTHKWTMQKVGGDYADLTMRLVLIPTDTPTEENMHSLESGVEALIEGDCTVVEDGETMTSIAATGSCFELHVGTGDDSLFTIDTSGISGMAMYTQHVPTEFERDAHYLKDSAGTDIEPIAQEGAGAHDDHSDHGDEHGDDHDDEDSNSTIVAEEGGSFTYDPHSWLDPAAFEAQLNVVLEKLILTFPEGASNFTANADSYKAQLQTLDNDYENAFGEGGTCVAGGHDKTIVANHNAYSYISVRYDIDIITVHGLDPEGEPSPQDIIKVTQAINEKGITVLFVEEYTNQNAVNSIVEDTGVSIELLYTMEMAPSDVNDDYLSMMNKNLNNLVNGIGC